MTRIGSLFTGYGGLDMAVQAVLGGDVAWYSEIEPAACTVLAAHYPGVPNLGDITTVTWTDVEPVDVLTGGYPCQPFSHAGKRKGKHDERHLWPYVRDAIGALRPDLAVLENVAGHLTLGFADVLADLASLGWDAEWGTLRAADAGAPHGRNRLWIIAYPARTERRSAQHAGLASCAWSSQLGERPSAPADTDSRGYGGGEVSAAVATVAGADAATSPQRQRTRTKPVSRTSWGQYEAAIGRWEHMTNRTAPAPIAQDKNKNIVNPAFVEWMMGLPEGHVTGHGLSNAQALKMLGNGVVPQQAEMALRLLLGGAA